ncbi:unnamed protein product [Durusdinium trenchii]|uniref:NudC domain-containing protein 1 n=1 Tax=Durusdinium trenchii TaxID=1381693 RepID=A0ABP0ILR9_9DINO
MALSLDGYAAPTGPGVTADQMHGLMDLLGVGREEEQDERSKPPSLHPAAMAGGKPSQAPPNMKVAVRQPKKKDEKAIWQADEFKAASGVVVKSEGDDRAIPKYEILPRQKLQASDAYLNLQEMDPSSDRCQELLIKVWLPGEQLRDISVDVLEDRLLLQATKHQLNVALPHKAAWQGKQQGSAESGRGDFRVRKDAGNAKWDKLQGVLSVCVPIDQKVKYFSKPDEPAMFKDETRTLRQAGFQEIDYVFVGHGAPCGPDESMLKVSRYTYENGNHKVSDGFTFPARGDMSVRSFKEALVKVCADWEEAQSFGVGRASQARAVFGVSVACATAHASFGHLLLNWVQQNHDRLAQKAGFPQAKLNEIHGAWGDTKNMATVLCGVLSVTTRGSVT